MQEIAKNVEFTNYKNLTKIGLVKELSKLKYYKRLRNNYLIKNNIRKRTNTEIFGILSFIVSIFSIVLAVLFFELGPSQKAQNETNTRLNKIENFLLNDEEYIKEITKKESFYQNTLKSIFLNGYFLYGARDNHFYGEFGVDHMYQDYETKIDINELNQTVYLEIKSRWLQSKTRNLIINEIDIIETIPLRKAGELVKFNAIGIKLGFMMLSNDYVNPVFAIGILE